MNAVVVDTANSIGSCFMRVVSALHCALIRSGRARAAQELARQGYYEEAKRLMLENQNQG